MPLSAPLGRPARAQARYSLQRRVLPAISVAAFHQGGLGGLPGAPHLLIYRAHGNVHVLPPATHGPLFLSVSAVRQQRQWPGFQLWRLLEIGNQHSACSFRFSFRNSAQASKALSAPRKLQDFVFGLSGERLHQVRGLCGKGSEARTARCVTHTGYWPFLVLPAPQHPLVH